MDWLPSLSAPSSEAEECGGVTDWQCRGTCRRLRNMNYQYRLSPARRRDQQITPPASLSRIGLASRFPRHILVRGTGLRVSIYLRDSRFVFVDTLDPSISMVSSPSGDDPSPRYPPNCLAGGFLKGRTWPSICRSPGQHILLLPIFGGVLCLDCVHVQFPGCFGIDVSRKECLMGFRYGVDRIKNC